MTSTCSGFAYGLLLNLKLCGVMCILLQTCIFERFLENINRKFPRRFAAPNHPHSSSSQSWMTYGTGIQVALKLGKRLNAAEYMRLANLHCMYTSNRKWLWGRGTMLNVKKGHRAWHCVWRAWQRDIATIFKPLGPIGSQIEWVHDYCDIKATFGRLAIKKAGIAQESFVSYMTHQHVDYSMNAALAKDDNTRQCQILSGSCAHAWFWDANMVDSLFNVHSSMIVNQRFRSIPTMVVQLVICSLCRCVCSYSLAGVVS